MDEKADKLKLRCEVGLLGGISLIAGTMIGSGIFMSPQLVLLNIGSPGASLVIWACSGLLAMLASLSYAELGTIIRESGGEYIYILRTAGQPIAFLFIFTSVVVVRPASLAGVSLSFALNAVAPFYQDCPPPDQVVKCVAAAGILLLAVVNCLDVRSAMKVMVFFMAAKVLSLAVIVIGGIVLLVKGNTLNLENSFKGTNLDISSIGLAFFQCLWSYDGWNNLNYVTEELKQPQV